MSKIIVRNIEIEVDVEGGFDKQADFDIEANSYSEFREALEELVADIAASHNVAKSRISAKHVPFRESGKPFA